MAETLLQPELILRWLHVIGAAVLFGTGAGIAFFMLMAHLSGRVAVIAHTARIVVLADVLFTATAAVAQPVTGVFLARATGWALTEGWILLSVLLYLFVGACWLPVVWIQVRMRDLALAAEAGGVPLPPRYHRLFQVWFALGIPAFACMLAILWLMLARPDIEMPF